MFAISLNPAFENDSAVNNRLLSYIYTDRKDQTALEALVIGATKGFVCDGRNKPDQEKLDEGCYAIVTAKSKNGQRFSQLYIVKAPSSIPAVDIWGEANGEDGHVYRVAPISPLVDISDITTADDFCRAGLKTAVRPRIFHRLIAARANGF